MPLARKRNLQETKGCLRKDVEQNEDGETSGQDLVVRVVDVKNTAVPGSGDRTHLTVTDGDMTVSCIVSPRCNMPQGLEIKKGTVIRIGERNLAMRGNDVITYVKEIKEFADPEKAVNGLPPASPSRRKIEASTEQKSERKKTYTKISDVNPFISQPWVIKARVSRKSQLRAYQKDGRTQHTFNAVLVDGTGNISITFFQEQADLFYEKVQMNKTYEVTPGQVKLANKMYNKTEHLYEIHADKETTILPVHAEPEPFVAPKKIVSLKEIKQDAEKEEESGSQHRKTYDVLAVVVNVGEMAEIPRKNENRVLRKRIIDLVDASETVLPVVFWEEMAAVEYKPEDVILLTNVNTSIFQSRAQIRVSHGTIIVENPEIPEAFRLSGWYRKNKGRISAVSPEPVRGRAAEPYFISDLKRSEIPTAAVSGMIVYMMDSLFYEACSGPQCKKKVSRDLETGSARCDKCGVTVDQPVYRYRVTAQIGDKTGYLWVSIFDTVSALFGMPPDELQRLRDEDNEEYNRAVGKVMFRDATFRLRGKAETVSGERRYKYTADEISPVDYHKASLDILARLKSGS